MDSKSLTEPVLISIPEAAVLAGKSTATIDAWRRRGLLHTWRSGSRVLVSRDEVLVQAEPRLITSKKP